METVKIHAVTCDFGTDIGNGNCRGYITSGTSWSVPGDWNAASNTVEVIGGGGGGDSDANGGGGGGGGAYAKVSNLDISGSITVQIGSGGAAETSGGDTFFNRHTGSATSCSAGEMSACADGGVGATSATGAAGGTTANSIGTTEYAGGTGGTGNVAGNDSAGGGGGAGGPQGAGANGGNGDSDTAGHEGSGGGGGHGGGTAGTIGGVDGGAGGNNYLGSGSGAAGAGTPGPGGDGSAGGGGGGADGTDGSYGGNGGDGQEWDATHGSGGGGGGGEDRATCDPGGVTNCWGGDGGSYGGGGGGGQVGGAGAQGIIVVTYEPAAQSITLVATSTVSITTSTWTSCTPTIPGAAAANDFMVVMAYRSENAAAETWDDDGGGGNGWTRLDYNRDTTGRDRETAMYYKKHDGSESNPTFTIGGTGSIVACTMAVYRGVSTTAPFDTTYSSGSHHLAGNDDDTPDQPDITTNTDGAMVVIFQAQTHDDITAAGAPTNYTLITDHFGALEDHTLHFVAQREIETAGSETIGSWTHTGGVVGEHHLYTLALAPASSGEGGGGGGGGITLSGTLYEDAGQTEFTSKQETIKVAIGTSTVSIHSTTTDNGGGDWHIDLDENHSITTSTPIVVWVDNPGVLDFATAFTKASSSSNNIPTLDLYQQYVIVSHEGTSGTSTTNADMSFYDGDDDPDIKYTSNSGTLSTRRLNALFIPDAKIFEPGGDIVLNADSLASIKDGSFQLKDSATYIAGGNTTIGGGLYGSTTATWTPGSYTTTFTATTTGKGIGITFDDNLGDVVFDGSGGAWTFTQSGATTSDLTITNGTVTAPSGRLTVQGSFENNGTFTHNSGTISLEGGNSQTLSGTLTGSSALNDLLVNTKDYRTANGTTTDSVENIAVDSSAIYVTGSCSGCGSGGVHTFHTVAYSKSNGSLLWSTKTDTGVHTNARSIAVGPSYVYVTGTCDGCGSEDSNYDMHTVAYDKTNGTEVWSTTTAPTTEWYQSHDITTDASNVYITGSCLGCGSAGWYAIYTLALDGSDGSLEWSTTTDPVSTTNVGADSGYGITVDDHNVYVTGESFDGTDDVAYTIAYDKTDASFVWDDTQHPSGIFDDDSAQDIVSDGTDVFATILCRDCLGGINPYIIAYSTTTGTELWSTSTNPSSGSDYPVGIYATSSLPYVYAVVDCGSCTDGSEAYVIALDKSDGSYAWSAIAPSEMLSPDGISGDSSHIYITGYCDGCRSAGDNDYYTYGYNALTGVVGGAFVGPYTFSNNASTTDVTINSGATLVAPSGNLSISGDYTNDGTFTHNSGTVVINGEGIQNLSGTLTGDSSFNDVSISNNSSNSITVEMKTDPTSSNDYLLNSTEDQSHLYVAGNCFGCGNQGDYAGYIVSYKKSDGSISWSTSTDPTNGDDSFSGIVVDDSKVYASGHCDGCGSLGEYAFYTVAYDKTDGSYVWSTTTDLSTGRDEANGISLDSTNVYVTGYCTGCGNKGGQAWYIIAYDKTDGSYVWSTTTDPTSSSEKSFSIASDDANVYVTGDEYVDFDSDFLTIAYDKTDGSYVWSTSTDLSVTGDDYGRSIDTDGTNVYVTGQCYICGSNGNDAIYTTAYATADGSYVWSTTTDPTSGSDRGRGMTIDDSNVYVAAQKYVTGTNDEWYVLALSKTDGSFVWASTTNESGGDDWPYAVTADDDFNVYVSGHCNSSCGSSGGTAWHTILYDKSDGSSASQQRGTVVFNATTTVGGDFQNTVASSTIAFAANATTTLNTATISGTSGNEIKLRSTVDGLQHTLSITGAYTLEYLDVKDSYVCPSGTLYAPNSTDSGNNTCWTFAAALVLSGTLYSDEGNTAITSGKDIKVLIGATTETATSDGSGNWSISSTTLTIGPGTPVLVFVDNETENASLFTKASSSVNSIPDLDLYEDHVIISHEATTGTSTTIADLAAYDSDDDADLQFTANGGTLTVSNGNELYIKDGKIFVPGGQVTVDDIKLATSSTYTAGATTTISGSFAAQSGAEYTHGGYSTVFDSTNTETINATNTPLGNTIFDGSGGAWSFTQDRATTSNLTITNGTLTAPSDTLTVYGSFTNNGTFTHNSGMLSLAGGTETLSGTLTDSSALNDVVIPDSFRFEGAISTTTDLTSSFDRATAVTSDTDNIYVTGYCNGCGAEGGYAFYTIAYSKLDGSHIWSTTTDPSSSTDQAHDITSDDTAVYVTGSCLGCGDGGAYYTLALAKSDGSLLWSATNDVGAQNDIARSIAVDEQNVYITGEDDQNFGTFAYHTIAFDKVDTSVVWSTTTSPGTGGDRSVNSITVDEAAVYVTGECFSCDTYTIAYDKSDASYLWSTSSNPSVSDDSTRDLVTDSSNIYITGRCGGCGTGGSYYTTALDKSNGSYVWATTTDPSSNSDIGNAITSDTANVYVTGYCDGCGANGGNAFYTIAYDKTDSSYVWSTTTDPTSDDDEAYGIIGDENNLYVTGDTYVGASDSAYYTVVYSKEDGSAPSRQYSLPSNASTTDLTVGSSATLVAPAGILSISGDYTNNGTFTHNSGTVLIDGEGIQIFTGTMDGTSSFNDVVLGNSSTSEMFNEIIYDPATGGDYMVDSVQDAGYIYITGECDPCGNLGGDSFHTAVFRKSDGSLLWATTTDRTSGNDDATRIAIDETNVYVTGYCAAGCGNLGDLAFYTIVYNKFDGSYVWASTTDPTSGADQAYGMTVDDTNIYVTGDCNGCGSVGGDAIYTIAYNKTDGSYVWSTSTDPTSNSSERGFSIVSDENNVYVTGDCVGCVSGATSDVYTIAYDKTDGSYVWATSTDLGGGTDQGRDIVLDGSNVYLAAYCQSCGNKGNGAYYLIVYDKTDGSYVWATSTDPSSGTDRPRGIAVDSNNVYLTGYCSSGCATGLTAYHTIAYDKTDGSFVWSATTDETVGNDWAYSVDASEDQNVYVTGFCNTGCGYTGGPAMQTVLYDKTTGAPAYREDGKVAFMATTTISGNFTATQPSTTITFASGATTTFNTVNIGGIGGSEIDIRSSVDGSDHTLDVTSTYSFTYVNIKDSYACSNGSLNASNSTDSGGNTCWTFINSGTFSSPDNYHFYVGQGTTEIDTITLSVGATIANDIRIKIPTEADMVFDSQTGSLTFGGTASGKVSSSVSYEETNKTLRINVTEDFIGQETLTISGIKLENFNSVSTAAGNLTVHTDGDTAGDPNATDSKTVWITGSLTMANHNDGKVSDKYSGNDRTDTELYSFRLSAADEDVTITDLVISLSGIQNITASEITNFKLYHDANGDGDVDGGESLIDDSGMLNINGQFGAITFNNDWTATSSQNGDYIVTGNTSDIPKDSNTVFKLESSGITSTGDTSSYQPVILGGVSKVQHDRYRSGGGGGAAAVGGGGAPGDGQQGGGGEGGGGGVGETDGENIAPDPDFYPPTNTGSPDNQWTNPTNAYDSDGTAATASSETFKQTYYGFGLSVPGSNTVNGIEVKVDASGSTAAGTIDVAVGWDCDTSCVWSTNTATPVLGTTDSIYTIGGPSDTWGNSWNPSDFTATNFRIRITANNSSNTLNLDALEVRVYHQASGGGSGGGGGI